MNEHVGIISLEAENIKRLQAVKIVLNEAGSTVIEGRNGQGKSSTLDSLLYALCGEGAVTGNPINIDQENAKVTITLTDGRQIIRYFKRSDKNKKGFTTKLEVLTKDGGVIPAGQTAINALLGSDVAFDPLEFSLMDGKRQKQILAQLTGVDLDEYERRYTAVESARRGHYQTFVAAEKKVPSTAPAKPKDELVDVSAVTQEISAAMEAKAEVQRLANTCDDRRDDCARIASQKEQLETQIKLAEAQLKDMQNKLHNIHNVEQPRLIAEWNTMAERLDEAVKAVPDITALQEKISTAEEHNNRVREAHREFEAYDGLKADYVEQKRIRDGYTAELEQITKERTAALADAKYPIEGLSFGEDTVLYNGLPLENASMSERLRIGIAIGTALHGKLRVLVSHDGSLLDDDNLALVHEAVAGAGSQLIIERVSSKPGGGIFIEDGAVLEAGE